MQNFKIYDLVTANGYRKSFVAGNQATNEQQMWIPPDSFACLDSLGVSANDDMPYEIFGHNIENALDRVSF